VNYAAIVARLQTQVPALQKVEVTAALDGILADTPVYPSAYLLAPIEKAGPKEGVNYLMQRVEPKFSIAIRVRNMADMRGEAALIELDAIKPLVRAALLNWQIDADHDPIELMSARLLYAAGGEAIWADDFTTGYYLRAV
jgi:hypothetical protein